MIIRVPPPALSYLRPALRLAGPARPVIGLQGRRAARAATRGRRAAPRPVVFGALETVTVGRGIDDRWWGPAPTDLAAEEEDHEQSRTAAAVTAAELAAADIDTEDLAALLTGTSDGSGPVANRQSRSGRSSRGPGGTRKGDDDAR